MTRWNFLFGLILGVLICAALWFAAGLEPPGKQRCFREHGVRNHVTNEDMILYEPIDCASCAFRHYDAEKDLELCR